MKEVKDYPPNIEKIRKSLSPREGYCFTYGDTIYNPSGNKIEPHLMVHESVHEIQQGTDPEAWWDNYIASIEFRFNQELEAYAAQYRFAKEQLPSKLSAKFLTAIASDLSSENYGSICTLAVAESKIRNKAKQFEKAVV